MVLKECDHQGNALHSTHFNDARKSLRHLRSRDLTINTVGDLNPAAKRRCDNLVRKLDSENTRLVRAMLREKCISRVIINRTFSEFSRHGHSSPLSDILVLSRFTDNETEHDLLSVEKRNSSKTASGPPPKALSRMESLYKLSEKRQQKGKQRRNRISEVLEQARQVRRPSPKENITKKDVEEAPEQSQVIVYEIPSNPPVEHILFQAPTTIRNLKDFSLSSCSAGATIQKSTTESEVFISIQSSYRSILAEDEFKFAIIVMNFCVEIQLTREL